MKVKINSIASSFFPAPPSFLVRPEDQKVGLNGIASFECVATGNPPPSVFWTKEGSQQLMFPGNKYGHLHVTPEGTLRIQGVQKEDTGFYVCSALSVAGSTIVKAFLEVTSLDDLPPPIIQIGPANQTLPLKSVAMLPCQASGTPSPRIKWYKNGSPLVSQSPRITVLDTGTLQIDGKYRFYCRDAFLQFKKHQNSCSRFSVAFVMDDDTKFFTDASHLSLSMVNNIVQNCSC